MQETSEDLDPPKTGPKVYTAIATARSSAANTSATIPPPRELGEPPAKPPALIFRVDQKKSFFKHTEKAEADEGSFRWSECTTQVKEDK